MVVGIVDQSSPGWTAGGIYTRLVTCSLAAAGAEAGVEVRLLADSRSAAPDSVKRIDLEPPGRSTASRRWIRKALRLREPDNAFSVASKEGISVLLPLASIPRVRFGVAGIGWIPDFQHLRLPEFFSSDERERRTRRFRLLAERAALVLVSSQAALGDFGRFMPALVGKARVASFPSLFAFDPPGRDPTPTIRKYQLPPKFALVANQFWAHKNHLAVVEAALEARRRGLVLPLVLTGLPVDYRDAENRALSRILQAISMGGVRETVAILGQVPYPDLVDLMRCAALVIQPSRFEGWSIVVEDAKALGRPVICSDTDVLREHHPDCLGFFPCDDVQALASLLEARWPHLNPGPDPAREAQALEAARCVADAHGRLLVGICREALDAGSPRLE